MHDYSATFACYNNVAYTQKCMDSLIQTGFPMDRLVVVDNNSQDSTWEYLQSVEGIHSVLNKDNMGCGVAWNQGILALQTEWTVIMNNDILVSPQWIENLIDQAKANNLLVASPAYLEGSLDYDFLGAAAKHQNVMKDHARFGYANAICLLVHNSVWKQVGYFRATPKLLGFEDTIFFFDLMKAGIEHACLANSWIHHFGSVTVKAMNDAYKKETGKKQMADRYNYRVIQQTFFERKWRKFKKKRLIAQARQSEIEKFGMTVHGVRDGDDFQWY